MDIANMIDKLDEYLPEKRKIHSINVSKSAVRLAKILGCDEKKAEIAGILHDTAKYVKYEDVPKYCTKYSIVLDDMEQKSTALSHSVVGSYIARHEFGIEDEEILSAIRYHTTGRPGMTDLEKSVYLADLIEVVRNYPMVDELRELAYSGKVDEAVLRSMDNTIGVVLKKKAPMHLRTVEARNYYLSLVKEKEKLKKIMDNISTK